MAETSISTITTAHYATEWMKLQIELTILSLTTSQGKFLV